MAETLDEIVERVARAITETWSSHFGDGVPYDELPPLTQACRLAEARAALTALARTHALVPFEVTPEIMEIVFSGYLAPKSYTVRKETVEELISASDLLASLREGG